MIMKMSKNRGITGPPTVRIGNLYKKVKLGIMNVFLNWYPLGEIWIGPHAEEVSQLRSVLGFHPHDTKDENVE